MTKGLPHKSRVATVSRVRKSAMMGAAATALIAAAPTFSADALATEASLQTTIRNILRTPIRQISWRAKLAASPGTPARLSAIDIGNSDDISVGPDETALSHAESVEDVSLVNTGNLTGGIGIEVATGATNLADAIFDETQSYSYLGDYEYLFDDAGNPVIDANGYQQRAATANVTINSRSTILSRDSLASTISITNSGGISFSGLNGIKTNNPAGESITISNSGDITSTQDTEGRAGIYASTETFRNTYTDTLTAPGELTRNAYGQLTGVVTPDEFTVDHHRVDMEYDAGVINIQNTGDIDMGAVGSRSNFGFNSAGIATRGDGGTTVANEGHITVDEWSAGIFVSSTATTSITNSGRIDVGNHSSGVVFGPSYGNAGDYRLGGDVYILNTGDIFGGVTKSEVEPGDFTSAIGLNVTSLGTNNEYLAAAAHINEVYTRYNELLGEDVFTLIDVPKTRLYDTTAVNQGHIELKDGGVGIAIEPIAGHSTAINSGTIIVGDGISIAENNAPLPSAGISQSNFPFDGLGSTTSINTETGIIVTGDDSNGIRNLNIGGDSIAINEGSITTGNGVSTLVTDYTGTTFDRLFQAHGMFSVSAGPVMGTTGYARNSGSITVGDLAVGVAVSGHGFTVLDPARITALNFNEGTISTGDNSSGMFTFGTNATGINTGSITTGDYDISAFQPHPVFTADEFAQLRFGMESSGANLSEIINSGTISTGDGKIGVSAHMNNNGYGFAARVVQEAEGVITTGDDSIGARVAGNYYSILENAGAISTGDASVGVDMTVGAVVLRYGDLQASIVEGAQQALNSGIIETGDNSIGVRMAGVLEDVPYSGGVWLPDPDGPYAYYYLEISGTAGVTSASYLTNNGTIRVGANSTAVEITGTAASEQGLHLFNTGTIDASVGGSAAIRLNADNNLDSYAVNVGTIAGNITFGTGNDHFINTLMVDNAGRVTHSGNIVMNGSTIDFGAGTNSFDNDQGTITVLGGENLITGADVVMTQALIEARNNAVDSSLTIEGNVSGEFQFGADFNGSGEADQLVITGDVAEGSSMRVVINPTEQLSGETSFKVITVGGENAADAPVIAGITGNFADSVLGAEVSYEDGEVNVTARFGMGHMATSVSAATSMAQHWWMQSVGSLDKRDMQQLAGLEDSGLSVWAATFHQEASVDPSNDLQDVSFDQQLSGLQTGIEWKGDVGGGSFSVGPMFSYGNASASQNANLASARGDASSYGLNAGYQFKNGLYLNASWQQMAMQIDFRTPGTFSNALGRTDASGDGFNVELGYAHKFKSGLALAPQLQYASVNVDVDDFTSSDTVYSLSGMGGKHSLLRAGVSLFKTFETTNGSITPLVDVSYLDAMDGDSTLSSNGVVFGNDTSGSGYRAELGIAGRYKDWDISGRVGWADTAAISSALSSNLTVRYRW